MQIAPSEGFKGDNEMVLPFPDEGSLGQDHDKS